MHSMFLTSFHGDYHNDFQFMELSKHNPKSSDNIVDNMITGEEDLAVSKHLRQRTPLDNAGSPYELHAVPGEVKNECRNEG